MLASRPRSLASFAAAALVLGAVLAPPARGADDFIARLNANFSGVPASKNAGPILFALLAKMDAPPAALLDPRRAAIVTTNSADWPAIKAWIEAQPQKDLLAGVKKVTDEEDWKKSYTFATPYGADAVEKVDPKLVIDKLYVELGEPALLQQADFLYLPRMTALEMLLQCEATQQAADGKPAAALDTLIRTCWIGRMMCDREFQQEIAWGLDCMTLALMRMRDVAYQDSLLSAPQLTAENIRDVLGRIRGRAGMLGFERINPPAGNRLAAEQLVATVMVPGQGPDADRWATTLGRTLAKDRPLRMFSEMAKWEGIRSVHANAADTAKEVAKVYNDFYARWKLDPFDPIVKAPSDYAKLDRARFALVDSTVIDMERLSAQRAVAIMEAAGTRMSLAAYGYQLGHGGQLPVTLASTRPQIIKENDTDPFDPGRRKALGYRAMTALKEITLFPEIIGLRTQTFKANILANGFLVYGVGPDGLDNGGSRFTQTVEDEKGDYLIWPPVISLVRQNLTDLGQLK
ncbi:hypothetical protein BH11PLA1_BH11PLA1_21220 [soil metagenome]